VNGKRYADSAECHLQQDVSLQENQEQQDQRCNPEEKLAPRGQAEAYLRRRFMGRTKRWVIV